MVRDSSKPVRGKTSPYGFFVKMCYEEHKKKYPMENVPVTEVSKKCSEKWKTMTQEDKKRFLELAERDAERYQAEMAIYGGEGSKKKKMKKDPCAPKRPLSGYFFFSNEKREDIRALHPEWKMSQVLQELGRCWKEMDPVTKQHYEDLAAKDKIRYQEEMKDYKATGKTPPSRMVAPVAASAGGGSGAPEPHQELPPATVYQPPPQNVPLPAQQQQLPQDFSQGMQHQQVAQNMSELGGAVMQMGGYAGGGEAAEHGGN